MQYLPLGADTASIAMLHNNDPERKGPEIQRHKDFILVYTIFYGPGLLGIIAWKKKKKVSFLKIQCIWSSLNTFATI